MAGGKCAAVGRGVRTENKGFGVGVKVTVGIGVTVGGGVTVGVGVVAPPGTFVGVAAGSLAVGRAARIAVGVAS